MFIATGTREGQAEDTENISDTESSSNERNKNSDQETHNRSLITLNKKGKG
jgi:hypothetical protein